jgi:putative transcription factor
MIIYLNSSNIYCFMQCNMCGKNLISGDIFHIKVEGTILKTCEKCANHGIILKKINLGLNISHKKKKTIINKRPIIEDVIETEEIIVDNYSEIIKNSREKMNIKQEDFAKKLNEKDSLIHKIETGHIKPDIKLAKKIGSFLGVKLIDEIQLNISNNKEINKSSENLTIGDIIKIRKS